MKKLKHFISKGLVGGIILTMLLFSTAFATMDDNGLVKEVDGIKVDLTFMDKDIKTGNNDLMIKLYDSSDKPIGNAKVKITADMDRTNDDMNMSNSEPLQIDLESSHDVGQYMGTINFTDDGKWMIKANFNIDGKDRTADFDLDVAKGGPNWFIIGGFLGVIAIVIILAAINKKRRSART